MNGSTARSTNGNSYLASDHPLALYFGLLPDRCKPWHSQDWLGELVVKCDDVASLMRNGLFWTTKNVQWEQGYADEAVEFNVYHKEGFFRTSRWFLRDMDNEPPQWTASLIVWARHGVLDAFKLEDLSVNNANYCWAWNSEASLVYEYYDMFPERNVNVIYGVMPMKGWWPWPREEQASVEEVD